MKFSTKDQDNDERSGSCAMRRKGAWWYRSCDQSSLNGYYYKASSSYGAGVRWWHWKRSYYSLKFIEMKLRPF